MIRMGGSAPDSLSVSIGSRILATGSAGVYARSSSSCLALERASKSVKQQDDLSPDPQ